MEKRKKYLVDNFIEIYDNAVPKEICEYLIKFFEQEDKKGHTHQGRLGGAGNLDLKRKDTQDLNPRKNRYSETDPDYHTHHHQKMISDYEELIDDCFYEYVMKWCPDIGPFSDIIKKGKRRFFTRHEFDNDPLMHRYIPPYQGFHKFHMDWGASNEKSGTRMIVAMLYLNDVLIGGETEFKHQEMSIQPRQGTVVIWPAGFTHLHRGNPPISNTKYIINRWGCPRAHYDAY